MADHDGIPWLLLRSIRTLLTKFDFFITCVLNYLYRYTSHSTICKARNKYTVTKHSIRIDRQFEPKKISVFCANQKVDLSNPIKKFERNLKGQYQFSLF